MAKARALSGMLVTLWQCLSYASISRRQAREQAGSCRMENKPPHLGWKPVFASSNGFRDGQWDNGDLRLRDLEKLWVLKDLGTIQSVMEKLKEDGGGGQEGEGGEGGGETDP